MRSEQPQKALLVYSLGNAHQDRQDLRLFSYNSKLAHYWPLLSVSVVSSLSSTNHLTPKCTITYSLCYNTTNYHGDVIDLINITHAEKLEAVTSSIRAESLTNQ